MSKPTEARVELLEHHARHYWAFGVEVDRDIQRMRTATERLAEIQAQHTCLLNDHSRLLNDHSRLLKEHGAQLGDLDKKLDQVIAMLRRG